MPVICREGKPGKRLRHYRDALAKFKRTGLASNPKFMSIALMG